MIGRTPGCSGDRHFPIVMIDGIILGDHTVVIALGIDAEGKKQILGLREGHTENSHVAKALLRDLGEPQGPHADVCACLGLWQQPGTNDVSHKGPGDPPDQRRDGADNERAKTSSSQANGSDPASETGQKHDSHGLARGTGVGLHFFVDMHVEFRRSDHPLCKTGQFVPP